MDAPALVIFAWFGSEGAVLAAVAVGVSGLFMETHPNPDKNYNMDLSHR